MSSESDTPNIDEVKQTVLPSSSYMNKVQTFITKIIQSITHLFVYVILAGYVLYSCKVAQSNLFPTESGCKPYTNSAPHVQPIKTNIFETFSSGQKLSQKIVFPYEKNDRNIILDALRQLKEEPTSSSVGAYIMSILQGGLNTNYIFLNIFLNLLNQLPEFLILIIGPFLFILFITILFLIDNIYVLVNWFTQIKWFFKKNTNTKLSGAPEWSEITFLEPMDFFFATCMSVFFIILGFILLPLLIPILSATFIILTVFSLNVYRGVLNGEEIGIFGIIQKLIMYYKVTLTSIIAFIVIMNSYNILGSTPGIFCVITVLLIYFGTISFGLFEGIPEKYLSPMVSSAQANKTCSAGGLQSGGSKQISKSYTDTKSFNSKLKQISKQMSNMK